MRLRFSIHYHTHWGQRLCVAGSLPELGGWQTERAAEMVYTPDGTWVLELSVENLPRKGFSYKYCILHDQAPAVQWEWGPNRALTSPPCDCDVIEMRDFWRRADDPENALFSSAFTHVLFRRETKTRARRRRADMKKGPIHRFRIAAPRVPKDHVLCMLGADPSLGEWNESRAVMMANHNDAFWEADIALAREGFPLSYKYAVFSIREKRIVAWEEGGNRSMLVASQRAPGVLVVRTDEMFRHPAGPWRGAGVAIPVFALRSRQGLGVGEFSDIRGLVDWAVLAGLKLVQLLPINDTIATHTWMDSYPYAAISVFALHPIYANVDELAEACKAWQSAPDIDRILSAALEQKEALNALPDLDYQEVKRVKSWFFKQAYDAVRDAFLEDAEYCAFFEANKAWLVPYAVFSCLRDRYGTAEYGTWPEYSHPDGEAIEGFASPKQSHYDDVAVHYFIQFHLHKQLLDAAEYARSHGVVLKGDIPIGVYRQSVDTWMYPHLFHMDGQAGAPPDAFAAEGQNWKFPTYNWEEMAADDFAWWRERLVQMSAYFDAFRIDHILGFFRIWEIPWKYVQGIMGHFSPSLPFSAHELERRGIPFDRERMCRPYIRRHMLNARFGDDSQKVIDEYCEAYADGCYQLKPEVSTQRRVMEKLASDQAAAPGDKAAAERLAAGLCDLITQVVFIESEDVSGPVYHPRNGFHKTDAYRELDDWTRSRLDELYIDYFYRRHEDLWRNEGFRRLPAVKTATEMLICGEDLGMVPHCVEGVMRELGVLSLYIQRMPKNSDQDFVHPSDCPYLAVCSTSTHDMSTVRAWWEENRNLTQYFYNSMLGQTGDAPIHAEPWVCRDIVWQHLWSPAMWAIFPLQDLMAMDGDIRRSDPRQEQINDPSNPRHYWKYRMHLALEDLLQQSEFNGMLRSMVGEAGRA